MTQAEWTTHAMCRNDSWIKDHFQRQREETIQGQAIRYVRYDEASCLDEILASVGARMDRDSVLYMDAVLSAGLATYAGPIVSISVEERVPILPRLFESVDELCAALQEIE